jgi:hypothetical protein
MIKSNVMTDLKNIVYLDESVVTAKWMKMQRSPHSHEFNDWGFTIVADEAVAKWKIGNVI